MKAPSVPPPPVPPAPGPAARGWAALRDPRNLPYVILGALLAVSLAARLLLLLA